MVIYCILRSISKSFLTSTILSQYCWVVSFRDGPLGLSLSSPWFIFQIYFTFFDKGLSFSAYYITLFSSVTKRRLRDTDLPNHFKYGLCSTVCLSQIWKKGSIFFCTFFDKSPSFYDYYITFFIFYAWMWTLVSTITHP